MRNFIESSTLQVKSNMQSLFVLGPPKCFDIIFFVKSKLLHHFRIVNHFLQECKNTVCTINLVNGRFAQCVCIHVRKIIVPHA